MRPHPLLVAGVLTGVACTRPAPRAAGPNVITVTATDFSAHFAPGNYLLLCFWPDAKDGKPHLMHGMAKQITVS